MGFSDVFKWVIGFHNNSEALRINIREKASGNE